MANIGMKRLRYALLNADGITYGAIKTMGKAVSADVSPDLAEGSLSADDATAEYASSFKSAAVSLGLDDDDDAIFAELLGKTYDEQTGLVSSSINDNPPYVGFGYIVTKMKNNMPRFRAQFFTKMKFKPFIPGSKTKGDSMEFGTPSVEGMTIANDAGFWEHHIEVASESEAVAALDAMFTQSSVSLSITAQPQDTVVTEGLITESISVSATASSGTINYQWYISDSYSNKGGAAIAGATSASFAIPTTLTVSDSPKYYYCIASHASAPSIVSNVAKVTITED